jgi:acetoin utilization deacetylase AcuC-like enzyme
MRIIHSPDQALHAPQFFLSRGRVKPNEERAERADRLLAAAIAAGHHAEIAPKGDRRQVAGVHDAGFLDFLEHGHAKWSALPGAGPEIVPNIHPSRHMAAKPDHPVALAGWYVSDPAAVIGARTWEASIASAACAIRATEIVLAGERAAYALCRPPGHHAYRDQAGGGCFLNNIAIAAEVARAHHPRVAILDVDVHHGNGTQGIFYDRGDVYFASIHADPAAFYPFYAGYADERGVGDGLGANLNLPLAHGTDDTAYMEALEQALAAIRRYQPGLLLVSLGLDAAAGDPLGAFALSGDGFGRIGQAVAGLKLPTVLIQEGGYLTDELGSNLTAFLGGFA